jgi:hypothetical protein
LTMEEPPCAFVRAPWVMALEPKCGPVPMSCAGERFLCAGALMHVYVTFQEQTLHDYVGVTGRLVQYMDVMGLMTTWM